MKGSLEKELENNNHGFGELKKKKCKKRDFVSHLQLHNFPFWKFFFVLAFLTVSKLGKCNFFRVS